MLQEFLRLLVTVCHSIVQQRLASAQHSATACSETIPRKINLSEPPRRPLIGQAKCHNNNKIVLLSQGFKIILHFTLCFMLGFFFFPPYCCELHEPGSTTLNAGGRIFEILEIVCDVYIFAAEGHHQLFGKTFLGFCFHSKIVFYLDGQ